MDNRIKISLIGVIVVIAVLGLVVGMMPKANVETPASLTNSDLTNSDTNSTGGNVLATATDNNAPVSNEVNMTPAEAMKIVDNELYPYYQATSAVLIDGSPNSLYLVHIIHISKDINYGKDGGNVTVDTVTGFVNHKGV